jgi:hypothetical protein
MLSAASKRRDPAPGGDSPPSVRRGTIALDAATRDSLDTSADPRWRRFLRHWQALAEAKGCYPARCDIDPARLGADLLPNVFLADVVSRPDSAKPRFRFRLLGQAILDRETTRPGAYLDELGSRVAIKEIERHYLDCTEGRISLRRASLAWLAPRKDFIKYSVLMLPLSDDGVAVTHLIGMAVYEF